MEHLISANRLFSKLLFVATVFAPVFLAASNTDEPRYNPPEPAREMRGAWIASVSNIDWPSSRGLRTEQQKQELLAILDRAVQLRLNAIFFQVRPACDALYASTIEPWSEYLTGEMGRPPSPYYDPLEFAVEQAHKRGLELHAWFNPYRARVLDPKSPASLNHISRTHPELVRKYVKYLWLDPGEKGVQDHSINVIMDVVRRYDVDGVHFDDYFYPYRDNDEKGRPLDFPDERSWQEYKRLGGKLERNDWRRENVNVFVERLYKTIKNEKPWVKFGISPFGIWKSGVPEGTSGLNAYESLYADSRKWFAEGWVDYFAPQLYWNIDAKQQSFPVLLKWWAEQNPHGRHLWPGISTARVGNTRGAQEIANEIYITRKQPGASGVIHWSVKSLIRNQGGIADLLTREVYQQGALVPAFPWLNTTCLQKPSMTGRQYKSTIKLRWRNGGKEDVWLWVLQRRIGGRWYDEVFPGVQRSHVIQSDDPGVVPDVLALRAVNRYGNLSEPAFVDFKTKSARN